jgi:hypothetical protein
MSINFEAVFSHELSKQDILALPTHLDLVTPTALMDALRNLEELIRKDWPTYHLHQEWSEDGTMKMLVRREEPTWQKDEIITLRGPAAIGLTFGSRVCMFHHPARWMTFLLEADYRAALRWVACEFAHFLGSPQTIYLPDYSAAFEFLIDGGTLTDITAWLRKSSGSPAPSIEAIYDPATRTGDGYYIDGCLDIGT